jgi:hypothetical protein
MARLTKPPGGDVLLPASCLAPWSPGYGCSENQGGRVMAGFRANQTLPPGLLNMDWVVWQLLNLAQTLLEMY